MTQYPYLLSVLKVMLYKLFFYIDIKNASDLNKHFKMQRFI